MSAAFCARCSVVHRAAHHVRCTVATALPACSPRITVRSTMYQTYIEPCRRVVVAKVVRADACSGMLHTMTPKQAPNNTSRSAYRTPVAAQARHVSTSNGIFTAAVARQGHSQSRPVVRRAAASVALHALSTLECGPDERPWYENEHEVKRQWLTADAAEADFWKDVAARVSRRQAQERLGFLDLKWRLGLPHDIKQLSVKQPAAWEIYLRAKSKDPYAVALVKVGAFYESIGLDAIVLSEHCGLQLMGGKMEVPRAGCPEANLQATLKALVQEARFSVAVWEEAPCRSEYGVTSKQARTRFFSKLVTPEDPVYTYGDATTNTDREVNVPTFYGVAESVSGLSVFKLNRNSNTIEELHGVSQDALWGVLKSDQASAPVVYMFRPLESSAPVSSAAMDAAKRFLASNASFTIKSMRGVSPLDTFQQEMRKFLKISGDLPVRPARDVRTLRGVRPLYLSTVQQLGLERSRGVPSLVDRLLPNTSTTHVRQFMAGMLSAPPPHQVADATRQAVRALMRLDETLPEYNATTNMTSKKVTLVLCGEEAAAAFFQTLAGTLAPIVQSLSPSRSPGLAAVVDASWPLLVHTMAADPQLLTQQAVMDAAEKALEAMRCMVPGTGGQDMDDLSAWPAEEAELKDFVLRQEKFRARVLPEAIVDEWQAVDLAYEYLFVALEELKFSLQQHAGQDVGPADIRLHTDDLNAGVWVKLSSKISAVLEASPGVTMWRMYDDRDGKQHFKADTKIQHMRRPYDRTGAVHKNATLWTCDYLDECLDLYRGAVAAANEASLQQLKNLTARLAPLSTHLAAAVQLGVVLTALSDHAKVARLSGWTVPLVGQSEQQQQQQALQCGGSSNNEATSATDAGLGLFRLHGLWPYWMNGNDASTVKNDVELHGMMLLTGPNMAGKSTVLRSVAAAALCGCTGLAIPAAAGSMLPHLDAVVLRTFSGDAPTDGLSGFGVEMKEMSYVLYEAGAGSLVLVDELGKGTEILKGTAVVSATMKTLAARGARGIFASHLHLLLRLLKDTPGIQQFRMELQVKQQPQVIGDLPQLHPTMRLLPGSCTESLAFEVARQQNVPEKVLQRAVHINQDILMLGRQQAQIVTKVADSRNGAGGDRSSSSSDTDSDSRQTLHVTEDARLQQQQQQQQQQLQGACLQTGAAADAGSSSSSKITSGSAADWVVSADGLDSAASDAFRAAAPAVSRRTHRTKRNSGGSSSDSNSSSPSPAVSAVLESNIHTAKVQVLLAQLALGQQLDHTAQQPHPIAGQKQQQPGQTIAPVVRRGAVHHLSGRERPPPSHLGVDVVYVARLKNGLWYAGETRDVAKRFKGHVRVKGAQELWYVLIDALQEDRKVRQGYLIKALLEAGFPMQSIQDAHFIRKK